MQKRSRVAPQTLGNPVPPVWVQMAVAAELLVHLYAEMRRRLLHTKESADQHAMEPWREEVRRRIRAASWSVWLTACEKVHYTKSEGLCPAKHFVVKRRNVLAGSPDDAAGGGPVLSELL